MQKKLLIGIIAVLGISLVFVTKENVGLKKTVQELTDKQEVTEQKIKQQASIIEYLSKNQNNGTATGGEVTPEIRPMPPVMISPAVGAPAVAPSTQPGMGAPSYGGAGVDGSAPVTGGVMPQPAVIDEPQTDSYDYR